MQIVQRWFVDMGLLRNALAGLATKPTLLIWGDRDRAVGLNSARELQRTLPHSQLMVLPGVGHIPFEEMPDACNQAMRDWLINPFASEAHAPGAPIRSHSVESAKPEVRGAA
jgi:pimeloyl-ACP methyl ester carboxylesterase